MEKLIKKGSSAYKPYISNWSKYKLKRHGIHEKQKSIGDFNFKGEEGKIFREAEIRMLDKLNFDFEGTVGRRRLKDRRNNWHLKKEKIWHKSKKIKAKYIDQGRAIFQ